MTNRKTLLARRVLCVGAVVLRDQKVVFVRQTYGYLKGKWSLPWGHVDADETPEIAALRETREEAGIEATLDGLLGFQNHATPDGDLCMYLLFLCRYKSGQAHPDNRETDRVEYFSLTDLEAQSDTIDPFCYWIACRVLRGEYQCISPVTENPYPPHIAFL